MSAEKVRVRFTTHFDEYRIADAPIALPSKLQRSGLSDVINHFLGNEDGEHVPFDFIINGQLLRTSLLKYINEHSLSTELVTEVEYIPALSLSDESQSVDIPAWVGSIDSSNNKSNSSKSIGGSNSNSNSNCIIVGCYDGQVQLLDRNSLDILSNTQCHKDPIRTVLGIKGDANSFILTGSKDKTLKIWMDQSYSGVSGLSCVATCVGHDNSIESVEHWAARNIALSGDWSGSIIAWDLHRLESELASLAAAAASSSSSSSSTKKRRSTSSTSSAAGGAFGGEQVSVDMQPLFTIKAHTQAVSGIQCPNGNSNLMITSSWDHSLKKWDVEKQDCISTFVSSKVVTSLDANRANENGSGDFILTSHPDGRCRLWDTRASNEAQNTPVAYHVDSSDDSDCWISQVKWHPTSEFVFGCVDYGGTVRVWDVRSTKSPLGSSSSHNGKGLCLDWVLGDDGSNIRVITGGSDCQVKATVVN